MFSMKVAYPFVESSTNMGHCTYNAVILNDRVPLIPNDTIRQHKSFGSVISISIPFSTSWLD